LRAHGLSTGLVADLIEVGLATMRLTMQLEHRMPRRHEIEMRRVKITDAGRQALAERRRSAIGTVPRPAAP
jgi:hypothetical protein